MKRRRRNTVIEGRAFLERRNSVWSSGSSLALEIVFFLEFGALFAYTGYLREK